MTTSHRTFLVISEGPNGSRVSTEVSTHAGTLVSAIAAVQTSLESSRSDFSVSLERTMALDANRVYDFASLSDSALESAIRNASEFPSRADNYAALVSERSDRAIARARLSSEPFYTSL